MSSKLFSGENLIYIIIGGFTLLLAIVGILLISGDKPTELTDSQKRKLLVKEDSVYFGPKDAEVVLVNFSDFQCPHCAEFAPVEEQLREEFGEQVKFVYRYYSLNLGNPAAFPNGPVAAYAAESANTQGKFWEMHDIIFSKQQDWSKLSKAKAQEKFIEYAKEVGVEDIDKFTKEMKGSDHKDKVVGDFEDGDKVGVAGTPTIFLNGELVEDRTYEELSSQIKELLND